MIHCASNACSTTLDTIYSNAGDPIEKRNSNTAYGNLIYDVHNYLAGATQSMSGSGTPSLADSEAYTTTYSVFDSPLTEADICAETYVIFISNPNASGPAADDVVNSNALKSLSCSRRCITGWIGRRRCRRISHAAFR